MPLHSIMHYTLAFLTEKTSFPPTGTSTILHHFIQPFVFRFMSSFRFSPSCTSVQKQGMEDHQACFASVRPTYVQPVFGIALSPSLAYILSEFSAVVNCYVYGGFLAAIPTLQYLRGRQSTRYRCEYYTLTP